MLAFFIVVEMPGIEPGCKRGSYVLLQRIVTFESLEDQDEKGTKALETRATRVSVPYNST